MPIFVRLRLGRALPRLIGKTKEARLPNAATGAVGPAKEHKLALILQILSSFSQNFLSLIAPVKKRKNSNAPALYFA
jgi:hypothetical protein